MDAFVTQHLHTWANREFREEDERDSVTSMLIDLWESDPDYFASKAHSWWELLDMAKRNRSLTSRRGA